MSIADDTMCMHYTLERLGGIKTQTDSTRVSWKKSGTTLA